MRTALLAAQRSGTARRRAAHDHTSRILTNNDDGNEAFIGMESFSKAKRKRWTWTAGIRGNAARPTCRRAAPEELPVRCHAD